MLGSTNKKIRGGVIERRDIPWGLPEWFVVAQVAGPAILCLPGTQPFRLFLRIGVFGLGLLGIVAMRNRPKAALHPAGPLLVAASVYVALMIVHPSTNSPLSGMAQACMQLAVVAPIFWAPCFFQGDARRLTRVLTLLWVFNAASAAVGVLQVRDPRWMPAEFSAGVTGSKLGSAMHEYRTDDGSVVVRPPGLADTPGAACWAGVSAASMGLAYLNLPVSIARKVLGMAGALVGVTVIFLTHVRSALVVLGASAIVSLLMMIGQKRMVAALTLATAVATCGLLSLAYASSLGGKSVISRFSTLIEDDPMTVYDHSARMSMVSAAFDTLIVEYPLGAGLGRWGMMRDYFGDESNLASPAIWAEVQFASWVLDGGVVLLSLSLAAIAVAIGRLVQLGLGHSSGLTRQWAATIAMLSTVPIALMFSFVPFNSQMGMQFWFLIGAIEGVAAGSGDSATISSDHEAKASRRSALRRAKVMGPAAAPGVVRDGCPRPLRPGTLP